MKRVERHIICNNPIIDHISYLSKNLYNLANYHIRQSFFKKTRLRYLELNSLLKNTTDYTALPTPTAQQILRLLDKNWSLFFITLHQHKKGKSQIKPRIPKYKHKTKGRNIIIFTNRQAILKNHFIRFPKKTSIQNINTKVTNICQVRIIPQATCYVLEVIYNKEAVQTKLIKNTYLSMDVGVNNLSTCVNNIGETPFVINGKPLNAINQYYNKKLSLLKSFVGVGSSNRIKKLTHKRNCKVSDYIHKTSRFILNYCIQHNISTIVIGKNVGWKTNVNMGKINNQNFVDIPFANLIKQLEYKAEEVGIKVVVQEEAYSSKCSFIDLEEICHQAKYLGSRIKRGLFKSAKGILLNADVNSAYNILRKAFPNAFANGTEGVGLHPKIINI